MALIKNREPKQSTGGYERLFDNKELGDLMAKVQSTVIANGYELERLLIAEFIPIVNLNEFINNPKKYSKGIYNCSKSILKKSDYYLKGNQPDLLIFDNREKNVKCFIIELKDGNLFDTKKSKGESEHIKEFYEWFTARIDKNKIKVQYCFCCFNEHDKNELEKTFRKTVTKAHLLTGKDFCDTMKIDYESIVEKRKKEGNDNIDYLINSLLQIQSVKELIQAKLK